MSYIDENDEDGYVIRAGERASIPVEIKDGQVFIPSFTIECVAEDDDILSAEFISDGD